MCGWAHTCTWAHNLGFPDGFDDEEEEEEEEEEGEVSDHLIWLWSLATCFADF